MKKIVCLLLVSLFCLASCDKPASISIDVYTVDEKGEFITRTSKEVTSQGDLLLTCITNMVKANETLFPEGTSVLSVSVEGNTATVDFSQEISSISEEDFLYINELCALAISQGERQQGDKIAKVNLLCQGKQLPGYFQYPYATRLVDQANQANFSVWMLHLYFPNKENSKLIREYRLVPAGTDAQNLIIDEMRRGTEDPDNKNNILPFNANVLNFHVDDDVYCIDFSEQFITECTPGQENLLVQAMVACYSEFVYINQVQLSVLGSKDIALGNFSFTQPLTVEHAFFDDPQTYFSEI